MIFLKMTHSSKGKWFSQLPKEFTTSFPSGLQLLCLYWVGQKVCLDFSITSYGKTQMNFLANPIYHSGCQPGAICFWGDIW